VAVRPSQQAGAVSDAERRARADERRGRLTLRKSRLQAREHDLDPLQGADAVSLVHRLTLEAWSLAGKELPCYTRRETRWRFVPRHSR
jgi:hypothetical protein